MLDNDSKPVKPGEPGEIVATGLLNFYQPLIRYRTGDIAVLSDESCNCGSSMPVIQEIIGRLEDTIVGPDGQELVRFHGIFVGLNNVREGQIVQKTINKFLVRLVVEPEFGDSEKLEIFNRFEQRLGKIDLEFVFLDQIERTERGKFRAVISEVSERDDTSRMKEEK
ncbi:MAG: hypothetical protein JW757_03475, partial [Anaerolineales bacterium]|nr:hypothetical protein [Anaerolineales bacterium]